MLMYINKFEKMSFKGSTSIVAWDRGVRAFYPNYLGVSVIQDTDFNAYEVAILQGDESGYKIMTLGDSEWGLMQAVYSPLGEEDILELSKLIKEWNPLNPAVGAGNILDCVHKAIERPTDVRGARPSVEAIPEETLPDLKTEWGNLEWWGAEATGCAILRYEHNVPLKGPTSQIVEPDPLEGWDDF